MATVYLAHDVKHDRKVALKVMKPELAAVIGAERFLAEIKTTANLQHPHILGLHDSGEVHGTVFYVMPFVEGESLRDRLAREKNLPVDEAIRIAKEVASALDYAHRHGVIHRDIKPENILLHDGQALVVDFGIALAASSAGGTRMTETGMSLGTPTYMSPEQAMGERTLDARTDVYALGCVLYEMLVGEPPFTGPTAQAIVARVLTGTPEGLTARRHTIPAYVEAAVLTALEKLPADRFMSAAQFADALSRPDATSFASSTLQTTNAARRRDWRLPAVTTVAVLAVAVAAWAFAGRRTAAADSGASAFSIVLPDSLPLRFHSPSEPFFQGLPGLIASPDGRSLVYVAAHRGTTVLAMRAIDDYSVKIIPGTEGAFAPFFSPDGEFVGFFTTSELRKVKLASGEVTTLMRADAPNAAAWSADGRILVSLWGRPLRWISPSGGDEKVIEGTATLTSPGLLPGGEYALVQTNTLFLGVVHLTDGAVFALTRGAAIPLGAAAWRDSVVYAELSNRIVGGMPRYLASGHLTWIAPNGAMMIAPFDAKALRLSGTPEVLVSGLQRGALGTAHVAVTPNGTLVYAPGDNVNFALLGLVDSVGRVDTLGLPRADYNAFEFSPNGRRLAVGVRQFDGTNDLMSYDLDRNLGVTLISGRVGTFDTPAWSPDGLSLLLSVRGKSGSRLIRLWPDRVGRVDTVFTHGAGAYHFLPDGASYLAVTRIDTGKARLYKFSVDGKTPPQDLGERIGDIEMTADARWMVYSGAGGVTVEPFPRTGETYLASDSYGGEAAWAPRGDRIYYRANGKFFAVPFAPGTPPKLGKPHVYLDGNFGDFPGRTFDVAPDGRRLVLKLMSNQQTASEIRVVAGAVASAYRKRSSSTGAAKQP
jgi:serine/threonine-protein kinase